MFQTEAVENLIDCMWVRDLTAPTHLGLIKRALFAPYQNHGSHVALPKLQMTPRLILLTLYRLTADRCI